MHDIKINRFLKKDKWQSTYRQKKLVKMECRKRLKAGKCQSQEQSIVEIMSQPRRRPLEATSHICGAQQHNQEEAWPLFTPDQTFL